MTSLVSSEKQCEYPSAETLQNAAKIAIVEDKPIMLDYWGTPENSTVLIGVRENGEKLLVKSEDEYTSPISKIYKTGKEYLIVTENSLYITSSTISTNKISS